VHAPLLTRFSTSDADEALEAAFRDRGQFEIQATSRNFRMSARTALLGSVRLVRFNFRDAVIRSHGRPHFGIHVPLSGNIRYERDGHPDHHRGVIGIAPETEAHAHFDGGAGILVATTPVDALERTARLLLGRSGPLALDRALPERDATGGVFARHALFVWNELARGDLLQSPIAMAETEGALLARMVAVVSADTPSANAPPDRVTRARQYIQENLHRPIRAAEIAEAAGVSGPTLAREFRRHLATSPVAYARARRLDRANRDLNCAHRDETSVAEVAARWGFTHLGEFAAAYARQFGERPSETLRR